MPTDMTTTNTHTHKHGYRGLRLIRNFVKQYATAFIPYKAISFYELPSCDGSLSVLTVRLRRKFIGYICTALKFTNKAVV